MLLPHARCLHGLDPYSGRSESGAGGEALGGPGGHPFVPPMPITLKLSLTALVAGGVWLGWDRLPKTWPAPPPKPRVEVIYQTNIVYREEVREVEKPAYLRLGSITNFSSIWWTTNSGTYYFTNHYATNITINWIGQTNRNSTWIIYTNNTQ